MGLDLPQPQEQWVLKQKKLLWDRNQPARSTGVEGMLKRSLSFKLTAKWLVESGPWPVTTPIGWMLILPWFHFWGHYHFSCFGPIGISPDVYQVPIGGCVILGSLGQPWMGGWSPQKTVDCQFLVTAKGVVLVTTPCGKVKQRPLM
jgi:hypothetical protein